VPGRAIAAFPFLKTRDPITLGSFTFRSTDDVVGLDPEDATHVREVADMLYLQDGFRIRSASYAILPAIDLEATLIDVLSNYARDLHKSKGRLYLTGLSEDVHQEVLHSGKLQLSGPVRGYPASPILGESTRRALGHATAWIASVDSSAA